MGGGRLIGGAEQLDCAIFAVIANDNAQAGLLVCGEGIANAGDGLYQLLPADFFAQVAVALQRKIAQRAAGASGTMTATM